MGSYKFPISCIATGLLIYIISLSVNWKWDLTEDKRYSISPSVESYIDEYSSVVLIESLFEGDFPTNYARLQEEMEDLLRRMRKINPRINYRFVNPLDGNQGEVETRMQQFSQMGLVPFPIRYESDLEFKAVQAFPYVVFTVDQKNVVVNILESNSGNEDPEASINRAISQLEYKFTNALQKLTQKSRRKIGLLTGHGELDPNETLFLERELRRYYFTSRIDLDSTGFIPDGIELLMVMAPRTTFKEQHLFAIDEYVARGGNIVWMIEKFRIADDSLNRSSGFTPPLSEPGLEALFFKYGVRFNNDLVVDLECSSTPIVTGSPTGQPQIERYPWFYHILAQPSPDHPATRNIDRINMYYPSSIEMLPLEEVSQEVLLMSSPRSRLQPYPFTLTFEILKYPVKEEEFNNGNKAVAVLLEGQFPSYFRNRLSENYRQMLLSAGKPSTLGSTEGKQVFISDADFVATRFTPQNGEPLPIGYNVGDRIVFPGNETFILNLVEYLMGNEDILSAKSKQRKLYLLNSTKANDEKTFWRSFNIFLPLIILLLFGLLFNFYRKYRYSRS